MEWNDFIYKQNCKIIELDGNPVEQAKIITATYTEAIQSNMKFNINNLMRWVSSQKILCHIEDNPTAAAICCDFMFLYPSILRL